MLYVGFLSQGAPKRSNPLVQYHKSSPKHKKEGALDKEHFHIGNARQKLFIPSTLYHNHGTVDGVPSNATIFPQETLK